MPVALASGNRKREKRDCRDAKRCYGIYVVNAGNWDVASDPEFGFASFHSIHATHINHENPTQTP
jgi:hypothetical protein